MTLFIGRDERPAADPKPWTCLAVSYGDTAAQIMVSSTLSPHVGGGSMTTVLTRVALLAALCLLAGNAVSAQLQSGRIVGTIFDTQRAGIPGATVTVTNVATNLSRNAVTDSQGNYVVTPLDPGTYNVSAEMSGFQTTVRNGLEL